MTKLLRLIDIFCRSKYRRQRGAIDLIPVAIGLPIILIATAAVVDLTRVPIARNRLMSALMSAAYDAERNLFDTSPTTVIDASLPAGNNLCTFTPSGGNCSTTALGANQAFLSESMAQALVQQACASAGNILSETGSGIFTYGVSGRRYAVRFGLVRFSVDNASGALKNSAVVKSSNDACAGTLLSDLPDKLDMAVLGEKFAKQFAANSTTSGGWYILNSTPVGIKAMPHPWLDSYWLVGVGYIEVEHIFGKFFGDKHLIQEYFVRPLSRPAGIQDAAVS